MKGMIKLGITLALYATAACVALAVVYTITLPVIETRTAAELETALTDLFPESDSFEEISGTIQSSDDSIEFANVYLLKKNGKALGLAIRAIGASYGGPITVLAGIGTDKHISGVKILENKDTPGLGANASSPHYFVDRDAQLTFYGQYTDKSIQDPFELKNDVAAITASTITSNAVNKLVKVSSQAAGNWLENNTGGAQ